MRPCNICYTTTTTTTTMTTGFRWSQGEMLRAVGEIGADKQAARVTYLFIQGLLVLGAEVMVIADPVSQVPHRLAGEHNYIDGQQSTRPFVWVVRLNDHHEAIDSFKLLSERMFHSGSSPFRAKSYGFARFRLTMSATVFDRSLSPPPVWGQWPPRCPTPPGGRTVGCGSFCGASPALCWPEAGSGIYIPRSTSGVFGFRSAAFSCSGSRPEQPAPPGSRAALRSRDFPPSRPPVSRSIRCSCCPPPSIPWPRPVASVVRVT